MDLKRTHVFSKVGFPDASENITALDNLALLFKKELKNFRKNRRQSGNSSVHGDGAAFWIVDQPADSPCVRISQRKDQVDLIQERLNFKRKGHDDIGLFGDFLIFQGVVDDQDDAERGGGLLDAVDDPVADRSQ